MICACEKHHLRFSFYSAQTAYIGFMKRRCRFNKCNNNQPFFCPEVLSFANLVGGCFRVSVYRGCDCCVCKEWKVGERSSFLSVHRITKSRRYRAGCQEVNSGIARKRDILMSVVGLTLRVLRRRHCTKTSVSLRTGNATCIHTVRQPGICILEVSPAVVHNLSS